MCRYHIIVCLGSRIYNNDSYRASRYKNNDDVISYDVITLYDKVITKMTFLIMFTLCTNLVLELVH